MAGPRPRARCAAASFGCAQQVDISIAVRFIGYGRSFCVRATAVCNVIVIAFPYDYFYCLLLLLHVRSIRNTNEEKRIDASAGTNDKP